jgi:hypothetical protein
VPEPEPEPEPPMIEVIQCSSLTGADCAAHGTDATPYTPRSDLARTHFTVLLEGMFNGWCVHCP